MTDDVPSPIDLRDPRDAKAWADAADVKRPWRRELRQRIADLLVGRPRLLELGPGPGLLAETILATCSVAHYTMLDFSPPFLEMCRERVGANPAARFVLGSFKEADWPQLVQPPFDAVVAMQAVHEIRHKRHVPALYAQIAGLLCPGGMLVVCDHEPLNAELHATEAEQHAALTSAGLVRITTHVSMHGMYVCSAIR